MNQTRSISDTYTGRTYKPGIRFEYWLDVPEHCPDSAALLVDHDGRNEAHIRALQRLADEGKAPYTICLGVRSGFLETDNGESRRMRMNNYDLFDREYGDFLVKELIPHVTETYSLSISPDPELHAVSGGSSGGISAFVVAWFHPDDFRRVYMSSPSFLAMGRGNEIPYLIRKYETKPLRIYEEYSENEPDDYFGSSNPIDTEARNALTFAGYDFAWKYFPGEGHCSRYGNEEEACTRLAWLFDPRKRESHDSPRVAQIFPEGCVWEVCTTFPEKAAFECEGYDVAVRSADQAMTYAAKGDVVYSLCKNGRYVHAYLHTLPGYDGHALAMAVDEADRTFVLTASGIQCIRSFGLIDAIALLPDEAQPLDLAFSGNYLYVKTARGVYRRRMRTPGAGIDPTPRKFEDYYDSIS